MSQPIWACHLTLPAAMMEDESALRAHLDHVEAEQLLEARAAGVQINGTPAMTSQALVWVDDWSKEGGALVAVEAARMVGITDAPTAMSLRLSWDA